MQGTVCIRLLLQEKPSVLMLGGLACPATQTIEPDTHQDIHQVPHRHPSLQQHLFHVYQASQGVQFDPKQRSLLLRQPVSCCSGNPNLSAYRSSPRPTIRTRGNLSLQLHLPATLQQLPCSADQAIPWARFQSLQDKESRQEPHIFLFVTSVRTTHQSIDRSMREERAIASCHWKVQTLIISGSGEPSHSPNISFYLLLTLEIL